MSAFLSRLPLALLAALALAPVAAAEDDVDPEPVNLAKGENVTPLHTSVFSAVSAASARMQSANNLKQIGLAVHNYAAANKDRLIDDIRDKNGKALFSWRVAILPYIEQDDLYKKFKLDEPWDSEHNKKLIEKMPKTYASPRVKARGKGNTVYQSFYGEGTILGKSGPKYGIGNIPDGSSNTLLAVESTAAVPWSKPGGIAIDPKKDVPAFGKAFGNKPQVLMMDGSVMSINTAKVKQEALKNAICPDDGNALPNDWNK